MVITHHGGECFKVSSGETVLAFNPPSKTSTLKSPSFGADIVFVSLPHEDFNGTGQVSRGGKEPFVISGAGEYEIEGAIIKGMPSRSHYGLSGKDDDASRINTIYLVELEQIRVCFLGALGDKRLPAETATGIGPVDVLFVPIGGGGVLSASDAHDIAVELEPSIVIPTHYEGLGEKDALKTFLKEEGVEGATPTDKLTLKRKDLEGRSGDVVVLSA